MLSAINLYKKFGKTVAVNGVSFTAPPGAVFGLLGPNGAGKTTTIRMLLNIITPDTGTVEFDGKPLDKDTKTVWAICRRSADCTARGSSSKRSCILWR